MLNLYSVQFILTLDFDIHTLSTPKHSLVNAIDTFNFDMNIPLLFLFDEFALRGSTPICIVVALLH
jgi:hypothetical protein